MHDNRCLNIISNLSGQKPVSECLEMESAALEAVHEQNDGSILLLWSSAPGIVVSGRDTRLPRFEQARCQLQDRNIEVVRRLSGGTAVPQGPGVLNLSLVFAPIRPATINQLYMEFCLSLANGFLSLGLDTAIGEVAGSFCDGRYNMVVAGRKLAGTAMKLKGKLGAPSVVLAHAMILAEMSPRTATGWVNLFYKLAGSHATFSPAACTSVSLELEKPPGVTARLAKVMADSFSKFSLLPEYTKSG